MDERLKEIVDILTRQALENPQLEEQEQRTEMEIEEDRVRMENWEKYEQLVTSEDALSLLPANILMNKENIQNSFIMQEFYPKLVNRGESKLVIDQALQTLYEACDLVGKEEVPLLRRYFHVIEDYIWRQVDRTEIQSSLLTNLQQRRGKTTPTLSEAEKEIEDRKLDGLRAKLNHSYDNYLTEYRNISRALRLPPVSEDRLNKELGKLEKYRSQSLTNLRTYFTENQDFTEIADYTRTLQTEMEFQKNELNNITNLIQIFSKKSLQERDADRKGLLNLFVEENEYQKDLCSTPEHLLNLTQDEKGNVSTAGIQQTEPYQPKDGEIDMSDPVALRQEILRLLDLNAPWKEISPYYLQLETAAYRKLTPQEEVDQVAAHREKLEQEIEELKKDYHVQLTLNAHEDVNMTLLQQMYQNRLKTVEYYKTLSDEDFYSMTKDEAIAREERYIEDLKVQYDALLADVQNEYYAAAPIMKERQKQLIAEKQAELDALPVIDNVQKREEIAHLREEFQQGVEQRNIQNVTVQPTDQQTKIETSVPIEEAVSTLESKDSQNQPDISKEKDDRAEVTSIKSNRSILFTDSTVREGLKSAVEGSKEETVVDLGTSTSSQERILKTESLDPRNIVIGKDINQNEKSLNKFYVKQLAEQGKISADHQDSLEKIYDEEVSEMFKLSFELSDELEKDEPCDIIFVGSKTRGYNYDPGTKLGDFVDETDLLIDEVTIGVAVSTGDSPIYGCINGKDIQNVYRQVQSNSGKADVQAQGKSR